MEVKPTSSSDGNNIMQMITDGKNPRGIPSAKFIDNVEEFLRNETVEVALGALNELYSKYKFMETSFERSKAVYKSKIPEIQQTIEIIKLLISKKENDEPMITNYSISDTIYAKAEVDMSEEKVCLWIGANTMVEYTYAEAVALLEEQRQLSFQKLKEYEEDLNHLRSCSITVEVNMARLFNHSVKMKKLAEASASKN